MANRLQIGDLFEVRTDALAKRYFQYIADDASQLGSDVLRVFRDAYNVDEKPVTDRILNGEVDFHVHVFLKNGLKQGLWEKIGHARPPADLKSILFRDSEDYGNPEIKTSKRWYVWRIGGPYKDVGELTPPYQHAEIGVVIPTSALISRMRTGKFDFFYPGY